ncbi:MAG: hypothetical protein ABIG39_07745 [Candidatus Micrarchaeota archaeon]
MVLEEFTSPVVLEKIATDLVAFVWSFGSALAIVVIGWFVGTVLSEIVKRLLVGIRFEDFLKSHKVNDALGTTKISNVLVKLVKYYVIIIFLSDALKIVSLGTIGELLNDIVKFTPVLFGAILVVIVMALIGELVKEKILEISHKSYLTTISAKMIKVIFIYVGLVVAMGTMGFNVSILEQTFATILQGVSYGIALAIGLAFGLGGQNDAKEWIKKTRKKLSI